MFIHTAAPWRAAALLGALLAALPAVAQHTADNPAAAVPETRYQSVHVQRPPAAATTTPDRNWQESNRTVAGQPAHAHHGAHADHSAHAGHAKPAPKAAPKADDQQHHGQHGHHGHGEHH